MHKQDYYSKQDSVPVPTYCPMSLFLPVSVVHCPCLHYIIAMTAFELLTEWTEVILLTFSLPSQGSNSTLCLQFLPFKAEGHFSHYVQVTTPGIIVSVYSVLNTQNPSLRYRPKGRTPVGVVGVDTTPGQVYLISSFMCTCSSNWLMCLYLSQIMRPFLSISRKHM